MPLNKQALAVLSEVFGYPQFRGHQAAVIEHVAGGGDAQMRRSFLDQLQHRMEHAGDGAQRWILLPEAAQSIEMAEELIRTVDKMDDHEPKK